MTAYVTNSGKPVTPEMGAFLRIIENRRCLLPAGSSQDDLTEFSAYAGVGVERTLHYIAELHMQYLEESQHGEDGRPLNSRHYVLTLKARAYLVDNNLDW